MHITVNKFVLKVNCCSISMDLPFDPQVDARIGLSRDPDNHYSHPLKTALFETNASRFWIGSIFLTKSLMITMTCSSAFSFILWWWNLAKIFLITWIGKSFNEACLFLSVKEQISPTGERPTRFRVWMTNHYLSIMYFQSARQATAFVKMIRSQAVKVL